MLTLTYIIDGNNLAHELFRPAARGQAQAGADRRLVEHLSAWVARRRPGRVAVEVYFDGAQEALADLPGVKVRVAPSGSSADEAVLHRAQWFAFYDKPCVVVSNDGELRQAAQEAGVEVISATDFVNRPDAPRARFVRRPGRRPASTTGSDEGLSPHARWQRAFAEARGASPGGASAGGKAARRQAEGALRVPPGGAATWDDAILAARAAPRATGRPESRPRADHGREPLSGRPKAAAGAGACCGPTSSSTLAGDGGSLSRPSELRPASAAFAELAALAEGVGYRISFETWPVATGRRFLIDSFCPTHRAEVAGLLSAFDEAGFTRPDLQALAEILLDTCGGEPDFIRRGSLMDQARRVLLLAGDAALPVAALARATGRAPAELRRKLKQNEGKWVERVPKQTAG